MTVFSKTVAERTRPGQRQDVEEGGTLFSHLEKTHSNLPSIDYTFHAYGRTEGVCGIIISDHDYPALVAHQLLSKVVDEFLAQHPRSTWANSNPTLSFPELKDYIVKYQDPHQADSIMKIQKELDETKIVLHKTIESVLQRGEKIDDLVAKSDGLSAQSKMFYSEWLPILWVECVLIGNRPSEEAELVLCTYVDAFGIGVLRSMVFSLELSARL
jgi:synaptobrevin family protein YKT6